MTTILNSDDILKLNKYNIGVSIDNMQSFVIDYNIASKMCDVSSYEPAYNLCKSIVESTKFSMGESIEEFSSLKEIAKTADDKFLEDIKINNTMAYGIQSDNWLQYKKEFGIESSDMVYIGDMIGIPVEIVYKYGSINRAYVIGLDNKRYFDVTKICKEYCNSKISQLIPFKIAHVIGKLRVKGDRQKYNGYTELNVMHYIRLRTNTDRIELVIESIDGIEGHNLWDILEYINQDGIHIAPHFLVRNVDAETLDESIKAINEEFDSIDNIWSQINGIRVYRLSDKKNIVYNGRFGDNTKIYKSIITGFSVKVNDELNIKINKVKCNDNLTINTVICDDLLKIGEDTKLGDDISFYIIKDKAYICGSTEIKETNNDDSLELIDY